MKVLKINSSSNRQNSISTQYGDKLVDRIKAIESDVTVVERHTTYSDLPFIDEVTLGALFAQEKTQEQEDALILSNTLVNEIKDADIIVITALIYNFSVPASLKAYFDLIARAGLTFQFTESGYPIGLLKNKKAYVVMSSGGTEINSDMDFAGKYVKHFLSFLGITDTEIIKLDQLMSIAEQKESDANQFIEAIQTI